MLVNRIARPSGRHSGLEAPVEMFVTRWASPPPLRSSTYTCAASSPSRRALNAIRLLSALQSTPLSPPFVLLGRRGPARAALGPSHTTATRSALAAHASE